MSNTVFWDYFTKIKCNNGKIKVLCNLCNKLYKYHTLYNLKIHLHRKHPDVVARDIIYIPTDILKRNDNNTSKQHKIWGYFYKIEGRKHARCKFCFKDLSYKTTVANLAGHLRVKHPKEYEKYLHDKLHDGEDVKCEILDASITSSNGKLILSL